MSLGSERSWIGRDQTSNGTILWRPLNRPMWHSVIICVRRCGPPDDTLKGCVDWWMIRCYCAMKILSWKSLQYDPVAPQLARRSIRWYCATASLTQTCLLGVHTIHLVRYIQEYLAKIVGKISQSRVNGWMLSHAYICVFPSLFGALLNPWKIYERHWGRVGGTSSKADCLGVIFVCIIMLLD